MWREWGQLFRPLVVVRVVLISAAIGTAIVVCAKIAFPPLKLGELWKLAVGIPVLFAYFFFMYLVHAAIPEIINVRKDRVHVNHGQSNLIVRADEIRWTRVVTFAPDRIRLRIAYSRGDRQKTRTIGVASKVDLDELSDMLPVRPEIWDARDRYEYIWGRNQRDAI